MKRRFGGAALALTLALVAPTAGAQQAWPAKPVTVVVGTTAGSGMDSIARWLAQSLRERAGQPFIVEDKPGAAGDIAAQSVARAAPDGYTVFVAGHSAFAINPHVMKKTIDPVKDFQPVTTFAHLGFVLIINAQLPVKSVADLTAYIKERPGKVSYASGSQFARVVAEWYRQIYGLDAVNVQYKSPLPSLPDLMAGRVDFTFSDSTFGITMARAGKVRALAMTTPKRIYSAPELPTMIEAGVNDFVADGWLALAYPARTPMDITLKLADLTNAVIQTDQAREFLAKSHAEPLAGSPEALAKSIVAENARWGAIVRKAGIQPE